MVDSVICAFSRGKDSLAVLDLCCRRFKRVEAYYMWWVKGLDFEEAVLQWAEQHYGIEIYRIPHFELARLHDRQALSWYRPSQDAIRQTSPRELDDHVRRHFNSEIKWIASGERVFDSLERRAMLSASGPWDKARFHHYPIMEWKTSQVWTYLKMHKVVLPAEYSVMRRSWSGFIGKDLVAIRDTWPKDYRKILDVFPFAEAIVKRYELYADRSPKKPRAKRAGKEVVSQSTEGSVVQPASN